MCKGSKIGTKGVLRLWVFLQLLIWKWFTMLKRNTTCACKKLYPTFNYLSLSRRQSQCISWDPLAGTCLDCSKKVSNLIEDWVRTVGHLLCIPVHHRHILLQGTLALVHFVWMLSIRSCKTTIFMFYWWVKNGNHTRGWDSKNYLFPQREKWLQLILSYNKLKSSAKHQPTLYCHCV